MRTVTPFGFLPMYGDITLRHFPGAYPLEDSVSDTQTYLQQQDGTAILRYDVGDEEGTRQVFH